MDFVSSVESMSTSFPTRIKASSLLNVAERRGEDWGDCSILKENPSGGFKAMDITLDGFRNGLCRASGADGYMNRLLFPTHDYVSGVGPFGDVDCAECRMM